MFGPFLKTLLQKAVPFGKTGKFNLLQDSIIINKNSLCIASLSHSIAVHEDLSAEDLLCLYWHLFATNISYHLLRPSHTIHPIAFSQAQACNGGAVKSHHPIGAFVATNLVLKTCTMSSPPW